MNAFQERRKQEERDQSLTRLIISIVTLILVGAIMVFQDHPGNSTLPAGVTTILVHSIFSVIWHGYIRRHPTAWPSRIYVTLFMDITATTLAFFFAARFGAFFYPVFLWVIVGYGLRYGRMAMLIAINLAVLEFSLVINHNAFWLANQLTGWGMLFGLVLLPLFFMTVLRRLESLNAKLEEELIRSQSAEKAKGEFLANMSHEIRTPLNGVVGMANILEEKGLDDESQEHLDILRTSANSLLGIVNDILDFSKITDGDMTLETVDLDLQRILHEVVQTLKPAAVAKGLEIELVYPQEAPQSFKGDPTRLRQLVLNLAANAVKFTRTGGVNLSVAVDRHDQGSAAVKIMVQDTGVGIPADRLDHIFQQFTQADTSTSRNYGGTGLGLAISRLLCRKMGGDIGVQSVVGQGSTFTASLLLETSTAQPRRVVKRNGFPRFDLKVLVAEDNSVNQLVIRKMLKKVGISAVVVDNGEKVLEALDRETFDLIFMDVRMPVMDGLQATRVIRARQDDRADIPIVALTADADNESAQRCFDAGMNLHLGKPVVLEETIKALESLLEPALV